MMHPVPRLFEPLMWLEIGDRLAEVSVDVGRDIVLGLNVQHLPGCHWSDSCTNRAALKHTNVVGGRGDFELCREHACDACRPAWCGPRSGVADLPFIPSPFCAPYTRQKGQAQ